MLPQHLVLHAPLMRVEGLMAAAAYRIDVARPLLCALPWGLRVGQMAEAKAKAWGTKEKTRV